MDVYTEIAEKIKAEVSGILQSALSGLDEKYRYRPADGGMYIRWGLVEKDIHRAIDNNLLSEEAEK